MFPKWERMNNHTARDLDDSTRHLPELRVEADFVRDNELPMHT